MSADAKSRAAASIRQRLLNLSRERGEDFNLVLTRYALERFLYRLSQSKHKGELILKGAMLFQLWSETPHRATRDMDFLATGQTDHETIATKIVDICATDVDEDGLVFDLSNLDVAEIREDDHYGGMRARFTTFLGSAKISVQLDFGFGDAVTPAPHETDYPTLLDMKHPNVLAYPRETVVAEKLEAIVSLGMDNSRMKDFFDLWFIFTTYNDDEKLLAHAVEETFKRRRQEIPGDVPTGLTDAFAANPDKQKQWNSFIRRAIGGGPPLADVIQTVRTKAMRLFEASRDSR